MSNGDAKEWARQVLAEVGDVKQKIRDIVEPPFKLSELFALIEELGDVAAKGAQITTRARYKAAMRALFDELDLVDFIDDLVDSPGPVEAVDGAIIGWALNLGIDTTAKRLFPDPAPVPPAQQPATRPPGAMA